MNTVHRLEDVFPAWRQRSEPALEKVIERSIQLTGEGAVPIQNAKAEWRQGIINDCLAWMAEREYWCNPSADMDRVHAEVASATIQLPAQFPAYPSEVEEMADSAEPAWALIGAVGSALGS